MYENNYDVFEEVDATAGRIAQDGYKVGGGGDLHLISLDQSLDQSALI